MWRPGGRNTLYTFLLGLGSGGVLVFFGPERAAFFCVCRPARRAFDLSVFAKRYPLLRAHRTKLFWFFVCFGWPWNEITDSVYVDDDTGGNVGLRRRANGFCLRWPCYVLGTKGTIIGMQEKMRNAWNRILFRRF